jgi:proline iminopeptidase
MKTVFALLIGLLVVAETLQGDSPNTSGVQHGYLRVRDGSRLYYERAGRGPVLITPGRLFVFEALKVLSDQCTVIAYDMRDRGKSQPISDPARLTIQDDVRDLEDVRRHFGVKTFTPVGYSYLGLMVVMYALEHPQQVERIVQLGPVPMRFNSTYPADLMAEDVKSVPDPARLEELKELRRAHLDEEHPREYCEKQWEVTRFMLVGNPANVGKLGPGWCDMPNEWPTHLQKHFAASIESVKRVDVSESARTLRTAVLTIHGTKDRNAPYGSGREWATILPNARLLTVRNAAHQSFVEYPEIVIPSIRSFIGGAWPQGSEKLD